jgi:hypothetical protein
MTKQTLRVLAPTFAIHSLPADASIPSTVFKSSIYFIGKTAEEVSVVVPENVVLDSEDVDTNWKALEVVGPLDLTLTGILANISTVLANANISIFAISTFDTDYILVKENNVPHAKAALTANDYQVI